jgi:hypothetical protein
VVLRRIASGFALCIVGVLCAGGPAFAQGSSVVEDARSELHKGLALFRAGADEQALAHFLRSRAIFPAKGNTLDAGICLERLGRLDEALELYEEVVASFESSFTDEERASVPRAMASLRARVGSLVVSANVDGAVVIDGRARGKLPLATALRVMPGRHQLRVLKEGYVAFEKDVDVAVGTTATVDARLEPLQASGGLRVEDDATPGADVLVDGVVLGPAPWEGHVAPGVHVVATRKGESGSAPTRAAVIQGQTTLMRVGSSHLGPLKRLTVTPPTAGLVLNDVPLGKGRWEGPLPAGTYRLEAFEDGYLPGAVSFQEGADTGPTDQQTSLVLRVDQSSARWPHKPSGHVVVSALVGYAVGGSFGSDAEGACPSSCTSHALANGLLVGARVGYELPVRLAFELVAGHLSLTDTVSRSVPAGVSVPTGGMPPSFEPVTYELHDLLRINAYVLGGGVSFWMPLGSGWRLHSRLSAGVLAAQSTDVLTGTAVAGGQSALLESALLGIDGAGQTLTWFPVFVMPELGVDHPVGPLRVGVQLGGLFVVSDGPVYPFGQAAVSPNCSNMGTGLGCARNSSVLAKERAFRPFGMLVPQLGASYAF